MLIDFEKVIFPGSILQNINEFSKFLTEQFGLGLYCLPLHHYILTYKQAVNGRAKFRSMIKP